MIGSLDLWRRKSCLTESRFLSLSLIHCSGNTQPWLISLLICPVAYEKHHMDIWTRFKTWFSSEDKQLRNITITPLCHNRVSRFIRSRQALLLWEVRLGHCCAHSTGTASIQEGVEQVTPHLNWKLQQPKEIKNYNSMYIGKREITHGDVHESIFGKPWDLKC